MPVPCSWASARRLSDWKGLQLPWSRATSFPQLPPHEVAEFLQSQG